MERRRLIFGGIVFLAGSFMFAAGFLMDHANARTPIVIEACSSIASSSLVRNGP